jgi:hypothetical protein
MPSKAPLQLLSWTMVTGIAMKAPLGTVWYLGQGGRSELKPKSPTGGDKIGLQIFCFKIETTFGRHLLQQTLHLNKSTFLFKRYHDFMVLNTHAQPRFVVLQPTRTIAIHCHNLTRVKPSYCSQLDWHNQILWIIRTRVNVPLGLDIIELLLKEPERSCFIF